MAVSRVGIAEYRSAFIMLPRNWYLTVQKCNNIRTPT
uniref:Uncharacterized protein n=1 Tax=Anguilla anguilla TaxID=7936 RepID=A0A0E9SED5_ANGAN